MNDQVSPEKQEVGSIEKSPARKSLAAKLAEACDEVGGIEKKGTNEAQRYKYVKAADVAKEIRHKLFSRGVVIIPDETECSSRQISFQNAKGETRNTNEVIVKTIYNITDGEETLSMAGYGIAWDSGDKAVYKAKTGALKYFLRGLGLIPDEKDDPEADAEVDEVAKEAQSAKFKDDFDQRTADQRTSDPEFIAPYQVKAILDGMAATGKTEADLKTYLGLAKVAGLESVKKGEDFQKLLKWAVAKSATTSPVPKSDGKPKPATKKEGHNWPALFAGAREKGYDEEQVKDFYTRKYGVQSGTELSGVQFEEVKASVAAWIDVSH